DERYRDFLKLVASELAGSIAAIHSIDRINLLMREVNHRAKNLLNLVQAIARQTASSTPAEFLARFETRLHAVARSHDLLVLNGWRGVDLGEPAQSQLAHFFDHTPPSRRSALQRLPGGAAPAAPARLGGAVPEP